MTRFFSIQFSAMYCRPHCGFQAAIALFVLGGAVLGGTVLAVFRDTVLDGANSAQLLQQQALSDQLSDQAGRRILSQFSTHKSLQFGRIINAIQEWLNPDRLHQSGRCRHILSPT